MAGFFTPGPVNRWEQCVTGLPPESRLVRAQWDDNLIILIFEGPNLPEVSDSDPIPTLLPCFTIKEDMTDVKGLGAAPEGAHHA